jgi:hypothetical protein
MERLYKLRTPGAADALYALLPQQTYAGVTTKPNAAGNIRASFGQRLSSAKVKSKLSTAKQQILLSVKAPKLDQIHAAVALFKAQRAQGKSAQSPSVVQVYRGNVSRQLDGYFAGKSPAGVADQRDQLVAQARTRFAKDPKTENGVISLITSEAAKHGAAANAGQALPAMTTSAAPKTAPAMTTGAPTAPHVITAFKPATTLKASPPAQQPTQQPAPSSMTPHLPITFRR